MIRKNRKKINSENITVSIPLEYTRSNRTLTLVFDADTEDDTEEYNMNSTDSDPMLYQ